MSGARLTKTQNSSGYTGKVFTYNVASGHSTLLAIGDFVSETGTGTAVGKPQVDASAAGGLITGVITSVAPNFSNLEQAGLPASTAEFFDASGELIGTLDDPIQNFDVGTTDDDRFLGIFHPEGVSKIRISHVGEGNIGLEVDHLQYGIPEPSSLCIASMIALAFARRPRHLTRIQPLMSSRRNDIS